MSRRRKAERPSEASAVRRASVEQDGGTPGTLRDGEEARQALLESRIPAGPHRKRGGASQRSQLGLHRPGQLIDGVVNPVGGRPRCEIVSRAPTRRRMHPPGRPSVVEGELPADGSQDAQRGWTGNGVPGGRKARARSRSFAGGIAAGRTAGGGAESTPPESSGAVEVAPDAFGVDNASVVPSGPTQAVPISSGG